MKFWFRRYRGEGAGDEIPAVLGNLALHHAAAHEGEPGSHPAGNRPSLSIVPAPPTTTVRLEGDVQETPEDPPRTRRGFLRVSVHMAILWTLLGVQTLAAGSSFAGPGSDGSIWDARTGFRYTNRKAMRVGDVITVRVAESASGSNRSSLSASKEHKFEAQGGPGSGKLDFLPLFGFDSEMKNELDGSGAVSVSGQLSTTLSVTVREIRPNGHLVVEGSRLITLNGEEERVSLHGVARPEDVRSDNSIFSTQLSEVRIDYDGKGIGKSSSRPGILQRVLGWIF